MDALDRAIQSVAKGETWPLTQGERIPNGPSHCDRCGRVLTPDTWSGYFWKGEAVNRCRPCAGPEK